MILIGVGRVCIRLKKSVVFDFLYRVDSVDLVIF